jgi:hypothetical protein
VRQNVAQRVSLPAGSIFKKLLHQKTFIPLRSATVIKIDFHVTKQSVKSFQCFWRFVLQSYFILWV